MKRKIISLSGLLYLAAIGNPARAQTQQPQAFGSVSAAPDASTAPGATSAGLNAIANSSIFDGSANINVPIHQFTLGGQDYGISLSYNTRGVTVDEAVNPAGLHFNISEASISRIVKDLPDELNITTKAQIDYENMVYTNHRRYLKGKMVTYTEIQSQQSQPNVYRDAECDDFIFSCGGKSFTFNLAKGDKVFTHPHTNVKITPLIDGVPITLTEGQLVGDWANYFDHGILEFRVTDADGIQYLFARGDYQAIPLVSDEYVGGDNIGGAYVTSRWVIKKITFANGNEINYNYTPVTINFSAQYYKQQYVKETWSGSGPVTAEFLGEQQATSGTYSQQLQSIQYPNGTQAEFIYHATNTTELGLKMLSEIKVSSGSQCLRYKFNQSKIYDRWFLNAIKLSSCDGTAEEPYYAFEYSNIPLPARFNSAQDYYGYCNGDAIGQGIGSSSNQIMIPRHNITSGVLGYGNERLPDVIFAEAGILKKVKNAFGGEVSFTYSLNEAVDPFTGSSVILPDEAGYFMGKTVADGLRVSIMVEKDRYNPTYTRNTYYTYEGGQLFMPGGYFHYPEYIDAGTDIWTKVVFQNMFLSPHQLVGGANHGYSRVTETVRDAGFNMLSKRVTTFSNMKDDYSGGQLNYYTTGKDYFEYPFTGKQYIKEWKMGLPMKVAEYDQNERLVKEVENTYQAVEDYSASAYITNVKKAVVNSGAGIGVGSWGYGTLYYPNKREFTDTYSPFTGKSLLQKSKVKTYVSDSRFVEDSTLYAYDDHDNVRYITTGNSKGEKTNTQYVYNYHVGGPNVTGSPAAGTALYDMTFAGLEKVVSMERWRQAPGGTVYDQQLLTSYINTFSYQAGILKSKAVFDLQVNAPLSYTAYTGLSAGSPTGSPFGKVISAFAGTVPGDMQRTTEVRLSDTKGNPLETQVNDMALYKSMIWDTIRGRKLAEVVGAPYGDIAFSGFEATNKGNLVYNEANIVAGTTAPGGPISGAYVLQANSSSAPLKCSGLTIGKDYIISFWCYGGTPTVAGAGLSGITLTQVDSRNSWSLFRAKFTPVSGNDFGFVAGGAPFTYYLDDVRIYPASATMQTYNYDPMFGMTSAADANGRITYYEYDKLGRQTLVRDQKGNILSKTQVYNGGGL